LPAVVSQLEHGMNALELNKSAIKSLSA